ncbi:MAG TPA: P-type conjugative transfer protein TrbL [Anaeromyxobacteraceae bacterium]|nr:P-type conjugative transfer protein TrbL [Anaeromyxobacteraceae bacterium]
MPTTVLTDIVRDYGSLTASWFGALFPIAQALFWTLALIELTWSAIWWVVDREDGLAVISALFRKILAVGFFYALLLNGNTWIPAVIRSFTSAGTAASPTLSALDPSGVMLQGISLAYTMMSALETMGLLKALAASLAVVFSALVVVVAFAIIAAQLVITLVESYIVVGAGILFLGFSSARWTKFFTERYLSYLASVGVRLFVLWLIMGIGVTIADRWKTVLADATSPVPFFYVMAGSLVFLFLTWHIPSVAGAMMAGAVTLSLADVYYPSMLLGRAGAAGLAVAGAAGGTLWAGGRWGISQLQNWTSMHTGGSGPTEGFGGRNDSSQPPSGTSSGPSSNAATGSVGASAAPQVSTPSRPPAGPSSTRARTSQEGPAEPRIPPNSALPL